VTENSLIRETSPYLLQHANNPVEWHSWNDGALQKARAENKPIFLSIGYSSCHWCHVMAHESFENDEIAKVMNEHFVNIKVDREERPDIDDVYQKACQVATGQGGWPLSVFLTPDQKPFYVGTYFPILASYGRPGFGSILRQLAQAWAEKPNDIKKTAENFVENLNRTESLQASSKIEKPLLDEAAMNLLQLGDITNGGFGSAPKFPNAANISFMFRYAKLSGIAKFQEFALKTLRKMARGGIFDQIGGGFHRYSTDARWLVPHFEKMLYDNALVPINYAEAYQITGEPLYLETMQKTLDFVLREMTSEGGGFYSAQDADSEGEEGKFYVWKKSEIKEILGNDADAFCLYYDVTDGGNWEGSTILCNSLSISTVSFQCGLEESRVREILKNGAQRLLEHRNLRVRPGLDDKILTSWNALMITALSKGYRVADDSRYLAAAENCISFIDGNLFRDGKLLRTHKNGESKIDGYLEDYAYYANALLDVFEINPEIRYLQRAKSLADHLIAHFWDDETNGFFMTTDSHESLIVRPKNNYDLSLPSGNSVASHLLLRLYHMTQESGYLETCEKIMESQGQMAAENPFGFGYLLNTIHLYLQKPTEITVLGGDGKTASEISKRYIPESILVSVRSPRQLEPLKPIAFFAGKEFDPKQTVSYVCKDFACSLPLKSIQEVDSQL